jgi:hypothetical protein
MGRISVSISCGMELAESLIAGDRDRPVRREGVVVKHGNGRANPYYPNIDLAFGRRSVNLPHPWF